MVPLYYVTLASQCSTYNLLCLKHSRTSNTIKLTVCVCVCVCVYSSCNCMLNDYNATATNSFYRLLATFSWILQSPHNRS